MQYLGGKSRIAKQIVAQIQPHLRGRAVWDPFCGGLSVSAAFSGGLATDVCAPLIHLYRAVQAGWVPPSHVTPEEHRAARDLPDTDPRKAFAGFGCSFGGRWFGGYARPIPGKMDHAYSARGLLRDVPRVRSFGIVDFLAEEPRPIPLAIYCDPPYAGTEEYSQASGFNRGRFLDRLQGWSRFTDVWASEYDLPIGQVVWETELRLQAAGGQRGARTERLYRI
jgi:DNA adenine methylase